MPSDHIDALGNSAIAEAISMFVRALQQNQTALYTFSIAQHIGSISTNRFHRSRSSRYYYLLGPH